MVVVLGLINVFVYPINSMKYKLEFTTQYRQFSIADKDYLQDTGDERYWTMEAMGVGVESYDLVKGDLTILANKYKIRYIAGS